jgi:hypothetical protein
MFEEYLLKHELRLPDPLIKAEEIMNDEQKLARIGAMVKEYNEELKLIVEARISPMREYLLLNAIPQEVSEVRYAILEVAQLLGDTQRYANAYDAMRKLESEKKDEQSSNEKVSSEETL